MIFEIVKPYKNNPLRTYLLVDNFVNDAWELYDMLKTTFPEMSIGIHSYGGYENCISIPT